MQSELPREFCLSKSIPTRLIIAYNFESDKRALVFRNKKSQWHILLFDDIREAVIARDHSNAYFLCSSAILSASDSGWAIPKDLNPDMTFIVSSIAENFAIHSVPFTSSIDPRITKIFAENWSRSDLPKGILSHPLNLTDRQYLFFERSNPVRPSLEFDLDLFETKENHDLNTNVNFDDYIIDVEKIAKGLDQRTTIMLRNIPNKYTQGMIVELLNESHWGEYDFVYLRIDFRNRCNVGYAFINFSCPIHVASFVKRVGGMKWSRFNSDKVFFVLT